MTSSNARDPPEDVSSDHLKAVHILLVEDSWQLGIALKNLLQDWGANVAGPVATAVEAERLISEHAPNLALVDFNLRGGELAYGLIDRLNDQGVRVIVTTGFAVLPLAPGKAAAILQKPFSEAQLLAALRPTSEMCHEGPPYSVTAAAGLASTPNADWQILVHRTVATDR